MKITFITAIPTWVFVLSALTGSREATPSTGTASHGVLVRRTLESALLHDRARAIRVYLPAGYDREPSRRYPVVYMLHGWPGGDGNWPGSGRADDTLDSLIASGRIPPLIAVMPNGHGVGMLGRSAWVNAANGRSPMADFVVDELVPWVDRTYRTQPAPAMRAILGLSDGGFGAFLVTVQHPDVFGGCASHSGTFRLHTDRSLHEVIGSHPDSLIDANDAGAALLRLGPERAPRAIYFDCGVDDADLGENRALHAALERAGIPHVYREFKGGHGWTYWRNHLHESLVELTRTMH